MNVAEYKVHSLLMKAAHGNFKTVGYMTNWDEFILMYHIHPN